MTTGSVSGRMVDSAKEDWGALDINDPYTLSDVQRRTYQNERTLSVWKWIAISAIHPETDGQRKDRMEFHPPGSPHMGGCWERLVGSVKRALKNTLKERAPKEEVLQMLFAEAEYSINTRPSTHVSDDPNDEWSLTPNDFLGLGCGNVRETHGSPGTNTLFSDADRLRRQWRFSQWLANHFWKR